MRLEPKLAALRWGSDEYLVYVSTAANGFRGRGFVPDYNRAATSIVVYPPLESLFVLAVFALVTVGRRALGAATAMLLVPLSPVWPSSPWTGAMP